MNDEQQIIEPVPTMAGYKKIPTFKLWIANQFPYIETDFDAITNYDLLEAVVKYLNTIIENENNVESNVTALYNSFVNLHDYVENYFNNLDVQEEINNKLDEMVEDGTLLNFFNLINTRYYDTFQEALNDTNNIFTSFYIKTKGYNAINDGGGATYQILETPQNLNIPFGNRYASLIPDEKINVLSLGVISSEIIDYTNLIQSIIDYCENKNIEVNFNAESYYLKNLNFKCDINGNGALFLMGYFNSSAPVVINYSSNIKCKNYTVDASRFGSLGNIRTDITSKENIILENVHTKNFIDTATSNAWGLLITSSKNIQLLNCTGENSTQSDIAITQNSSVSLKKCNAHYLNIEPNSSNKPVIVNINKCNFDIVSAKGNHKLYLYIFLNIIDSFIKTLKPDGCILNEVNSYFDEINCFSNYVPAGFRGNVPDVVTGRELNPNPTLENIISGNTITNGYKIEYSPRPLTEVCRYSDVIGIGNLFEINFDHLKTLILNLQNKIKVKPNTCYMVKYKYLSNSTSPVNQGGTFMRVPFYDVDGNLAQSGIYYDGWTEPNVDDNTIKEEYIITKSPENADTLDLNFGSRSNSTVNYKILEISIKEVSFKKFENITIFE